LFVLAFGGPDLVLVEQRVDVNSDIEGLDVDRRYSDMLMGDRIGLEHDRLEPAGLGQGVIGERDDLDI